MLVQSGKPVGVFKTHINSPRVLIANSNLVPNWANWDHFNELDKRFSNVWSNDCRVMDLHWNSRNNTRYL